MVAHGWNVDYSARSLQTASTALGRGKLIEEGSGRARCWVSEGTDFGLYLRDAGPSALVRKGGVMGGWSLLENCTVDASICGQVFKGARWMPWHQEPMKDVGGHDSPRGAVNQALIRGFPNGETRQSSWAVTHT